MIERRDVERIAKSYIEDKLKNHTYSRDLVIKDPQFKIWVDQCHELCVKLDREGFVPSKRAMEHFIKQAVIARGKLVLDRAEAIITEKFSKSDPKITDTVDKPIA